MKKLIIILLACLTASFLWAQNSSTPRFALVLGNQTYKESPLKNPVADAQIMRDALKSCGFDVTFATDLDQSALRTLVAEYAEKVEAAGKQSISFFYYSGHGVQIKGKNYMVPVDDKGITSETKAMGICYSIDQLFELIPSETQIVVLDACRNNPFSSAKVTFQKGLSRIANPKGIKNFMAFFSTSDGATAADGSGRNSVFTESLASHIQNDLNVSVSTVFNNVAGEVKNSTKGQQTPLVTGTGVNFELMNSDVAKAMIARINNQLKTSSSQAVQDKKYATEKKLLESDLALMNRRKTEADEDAKVKAKEKKAREEQAKKNQADLKRVQNELAKQQQELQKNKGTQQKCEDFVTQIEDHKERLQKIRLECADRIYAADNATQKKTDKKISDINNAPLKITEKDADGKPNSQTLKKRKEQIKKINEDNVLEKQKNYETYYSNIQEEETDLVNGIDADNRTLNSSLYTLSSFDNEVEFSISDYDGENNQWLVTCSSNYLGRKDLFDIQIAVPYKELCTKVLEKEYIDPKKFTLDQSDLYDQYNDDIARYDGYFKANKKILVLEVDYKFTTTSEVSTYRFSAASCRVKIMESGKDLITLNEVKYSRSTKIEWKKKQTQLKTVEKILDGYHKRGIKEQKEKEKAAKETTGNKQ